MTGWIVVEHQRLCLIPAQPLAARHVSLARLSSSRSDSSPCSLFSSCCLSVDWKAQDPGPPQAHRIRPSRPRDMVEGP